jgi:hypothetical protein
VETGPNPELLENAAQRKSLTKVMAQNEHARVLVEESAEELSSVYAGIRNAFEKGEAVEVRVQDASNKPSSKT